MKQLPKKVFVAFKTHFDIGFTDLAKNVTDWYSKGMIQGALDVCRSSEDETEGRRYTWTVPAWCMDKTIKGIADANIKEETEHFLRSGQLVWHALPFTTHTEACGAEDFSRGLLIGRRLEKEYGREVHAAKMTDVPGHTWILPSILHKAGVTFLHLGCNDCSTSPDLPRLFWWEGPDGGRVLTYYSKGGYGSSLLPPDDWEYPYWLAMIHTGDNQGAQNAKFLQELFEEAERDLPGVPVQIGTLQDFGDAMLEAGIEFPVIRGDMSDTWIRGVGSTPQGVSLMRKLQSSLPNREAAVNLQRLMQLPVADTKSMEENAYEKLLLFGEHTWSIDTKVSILPPRAHGEPWGGFRFWGSGNLNRELFEELCKTDPDYLKLQESWEEQLDYLRSAKTSVLGLEEVSCAQIPSGEGFTVFGSLGVPCVCPVEIGHLLPKEKTYTCVLDEENNRYPVYELADGTLAADLPLPALGSAEFTFAEEAFSKQTIGRMEGQRAILENENLRLCLDSKSGMLTSFYDKQNDKEWVDTDAASGFGEYRYDIYSGEELLQYLKDYAYDLRDWGVNDLGKAGYPRTQPHLTFRPEMTDVHLENTTSAGVLIWKMQNKESAELYGDGEELEFVLSLGADATFADFSVKIHKKHPTPLLESGYLAFPLAAGNPEFRLNKLGCVLNPEEDILPDCNRDLYCVESWMAVEDGNCGFAVMPKDMPLLSFGEPGVLKFQPNPGKQKPVVMMQLFNNTWGTNFPQWSQGEMAFSYRLMPYAGEWNQAGVWQKAQAYRSQPFAAKGKGKIEDLLPEGLPDMLLSAWKRSEDQSGWILRVHDISGVSQTKRIKLSPKIGQVWNCRLTEQKQEPCVLQEQALAFESKPFEIHTFFIEGKK